MIRKNAWILALACISAGLMFAPAAPAHTLSVDDAEDAAQKSVDANSGKGRLYVRGEVSCRRLFPHIARCKRTFITRKNRTCKDAVVPHYKAHKKNRVPNYHVYVDQDKRYHDCT